MSQAVVIKSSKCGIHLMLHATMEFSELLQEIVLRFKEAERFFAGASFAISFEGRELAEEQKYQIVESIMENTSVKILCIMEEDAIRDAVITAKIKEQERLETAENLAKKVTGAFYHGTIFAGEKVETNESIVVIGDVLEGATVISQGDVIVLGTLKGSVYAGMDGSPNRFITALSFEPDSYNISGVYGAPIKKEKTSLFLKRNKSSQGIIATLCDGIINVSPIL